MVGPTWLRAVLTLGSDYVLVLSQRTCLVMWCLGRHMSCYLVCSCWLCVMCPSPAIACVRSRDIWGCISTSSSCDYACVRPLSWYSVSHDGLCTIFRRTIVLVMRTRFAD